MSKGFIPDKLKLSKPLPDKLGELSQLEDVMAANVELFLLLWFNVKLVRKG